MPKREGDKNRYQKFLSIQSLFDSSNRLKRMGVIENGKQLEIYTRWPDLVGMDVAKRSRPLKLRSGTLTVAVANSTWMQQLTMLKPTVLKALASHLGEGVVRDLRLTTRDYDSGAGK